MSPLYFLPFLLLIFLQIFGIKNPTDKQIRELILRNPHLVDTYFANRTEKFVKHWLYGHLNASWHWYRFEYASRGSIHCHGLAKLKDDPGLVDLTAIALKGFIAKKKLLSNKGELLDDNKISLNSLIEDGEITEKEVRSYVDKLVTAINPISSDDYWLKPKTHPCKLLFSDISDYDSDYVDLVNSIQKHSCNSAYCLRMVNNEKQCRFNFPHDCCEKSYLQFTKVHTKDNSTRFKADVVHARNDPRVNRHQRVQLQGWRANADISAVIDYHSCVQYLTKYASKPEKLSSVALDAFSHVAKNFSETSFDSASVIKKNL